MSTTRRVVRTDVIVNVYDLVENNDMLYPLGLGAYHSGVEINNQGRFAVRRVRPRFAL